MLLATVERAGGRPEEEDDDDAMFLDCGAGLTGKGD